jgi:hypothetical protein
MAKVTKSEIRQIVEEAILQALFKFEISKISGKTSKLLKSFSKELSAQIKSEVKKKEKKTATDLKNSKKGKRVKNVEEKGT